VRVIKEGGIEKSSKWSKCIGYGYSAIKKLFMGRKVNKSDFISYPVSNTCSNRKNEKYIG